MNWKRSSKGACWSKTTCLHRAKQRALTVEKGGNKKIWSKNQATSLGTNCNLEASIKGGTPKWSVYTGESHWNGWCRSTPIWGNHHLVYSWLALTFQYLWMSLCLHREGFCGHPPSAVAAGVTQVLPGAWANDLAVRVRETMGPCMSCVMCSRMIGSIQ